MSVLRYTQYTAQYRPTPQQGRPHIHWCFFVPISHLRCRLCRPDPAELFTQRQTLRDFISGWYVHDHTAIIRIKQKAKQLNAVRSLRRTVPQTFAPNILSYSLPILKKQTCL